jgi:hypothetical protein
MQTDREPIIRLALTPEQACTLLEAIAYSIADGDPSPDLQEIWRQACDELGDLTVVLTGADR